MRIHRLVIFCFAFVAMATLVSGAALAKGSKPTPPPVSLRAFLLSPSEPVAHVFPRTPAFAWAPTRGALCYEFELATSRRFGENAIIWSNVRYGVKPGGGCKSVAAVAASQTTPGTSTSSGTAATGSTSSTGSSSTSGSTSGTGATASDPAVDTVIAPLRVPAVSVDVALPWFTGQPYALYAHVRAITAKGPTGWSEPFAFNMRWPSVPTPLPTQPGLVRWAGVSGATGYQVWYPDVDKVFSVHTNVADLREFYTLHSWYTTVNWRVRAVRRVFGTVPNGLPVVSYGPWSPVYQATNPGFATGALHTTLAVSDETSDGAKQSAHELMPGLVYSGDTGTNGTTYALFRAYASTDADCVNIVYKGSIVGSPAYAPRTSGPLAMGDLNWAITQAGLSFPHAVPDGTPTAKEWSNDWRPITSNEVAATAGGSSGGTGGSSGTSGSSSSSSGGSGSSTGGGTIDESASVVGTRVDLPDIDFPTTRYYWTVVPVVWAVNSSNDQIRGWWDAETPQDACANGRVESFGKESDPVMTGEGGKPFVSGLTPNGRLLASAGKAPRVFSTPLIAWQPATGATAYEVQWSRTRYPWRAQGSKLTYSTSAVLDLTPGTWYYRVRGLNQTQLKKQEMSWSAPITITVARPSFRLVASAK
jgi:uncharacterized membrane protein YgcG